MRKVDIAHRVGYMLPEDAIEKIEALEGIDCTVGTIREIFTKFKHYDYSIDITFYAEKDVGEAPKTLIFTVEGENNEPR